jgi:hypothetical protein
VPGHMGMPEPSDPIVVRSSFKATMNLMSGSYSRCVGLCCGVAGGRE